MVKDAGASWVIVGHSERREHHNETNALVAAKAKAAWVGGLLSIICIGETEPERRAGQALSVCAKQLAGSVPDGMTAAANAIGYEPLWAIGTGHTPNVDATRHRSLADKRREGYMHVYEQCLSATSTRRAPWYAIPVGKQGRSSPHPKRQ